MTTLTNADLAAIRERHSGNLYRCPDCGSTFYVGGVFAHKPPCPSNTDVPALLETIEELRGVIAAIVHDTAGWDIHGGEDYYVSADLVDRARNLLAKMEKED